MIRTATSQDGLTLLITLLLMGVLLGITTSLVNITLKQYQFSGIAHDSEVAFQAANAGMECAQYHDWVSGRFDIGQSRATGMSCFGQSSADVSGNSGNVTSGMEQRFAYTWNGLCTEISVYKFSNAGSSVQLRLNNTGSPVRSDPCPAGAECTYIEARGYNVACSARATSPRAVEREYTILY